LHDRRFIRRHYYAAPHGRIQSDDYVQRLGAHEPKQQSARVWFVVCILRDGLAISHYRQNSVPANPTLEHALDGMATEYHSFAFH
jgi:hypothetical protein